MRVLLPTAAAVLFSGLLVAGPSPLTPEVLRMVPNQYNLNSPQYRFAKKELEETVRMCGPGVVEGAVGRDGAALENTCGYQVRLDDLFFTPLKDKTGLLPDPNWAYADGVTWVEAPPQDIPDKLDLRDLMKNGIPDLRTQNCGDCWAWATHHGLELARAIHDQTVFDHSIQTVLSCSKAGSCGGGYMKAVDFLLNGLPMESEFPYAGSDKSCKFNSSQINTGWTGKVIATPYVGSSLTYSRFMRDADGNFREGTKVQAMMAAMNQWKSPLVVTVAAYSISGSGIYDSCSSINSGGNHMVAISGFETVNGKRIAQVWNSWGKSHGENGVSRIQWECGDGRLNRGLGTSAKIVQYKPACTPPDAAQPFLHEIAAGGSVQIGVAQSEGTKCVWQPSEGLADPNACVTMAKPSQSTEYHLTATNACGTSSSMTLVDVWLRNAVANAKKMILTPFGEVPFQR